MRTLRYYQVDAFTSELFKGNPAGVCILEGSEWLQDDLMQRIAFENNQAETAFVLPRGGIDFGLRWFTPTVEIDLCGHATLAAAFIIFTNEWQWTGEQVRFHSKSGLLTVNAVGELIELDFPARAGQMTEPPTDVIAAIGRKPTECLRARDWLFVYETAEEVVSIKPNFEKLNSSVIVTAPGRTSDFVSRFFAPNFGVNEDPVTGSAHCTLVPYWAERLGKTKLHARQLSRRTGELSCEFRGERVGIAGRAVLYSSGLLFLCPS